MALNFNGVDLPNGFGITSLVVSTPKVDIRTLDSPARRGLIRAGGKFGNRTVQITLAMESGTAAENIAKLGELYAWLQADEPKPLYLPDVTGAYLLAECDTYPPMDLNKPAEEFDISFTCNRPEFIAASESSAEVNSRFTIGGTLPTWITIKQTVSETITNPMWVLNTGEIIKLEGEIDAGELVIDCEKEIVTLDGNNITEQATLESELGLCLAPETYQVVASNGAAGSVYWRNVRLWGWNE